MKLSSSHEQLLSFCEARQAVENQAKRFKSADAEKVSLNRALARFLAMPLYADRDFPPFPRATRDGFAVQSADLAAIPARLKIVGEIKAGAAPESMLRKLLPGETFAIMTGAPVPIEANAVLMLEHTRRCHDGSSIEALRQVAAGKNIVPRGAEAGESQLLFDVGTRLTPTGIAVAASAGYSTVTVFRRPQVAVLVTGDEIVPVHTFPGPSQVRDSNLHSLGAQIELAGGEPVPLPIAPDHPRELRELIGAALQYDLALFSGGVSMGKYDLVEEVLKEFKAEFHFTGARIQPGKPIVFGEAEAPVKRGRKRSTAARDTVEIRRVPFFGLPGNPVSTLVTFELFVAPVLRALAGGEPAPLLFASARLKTELCTPVGLTRFLPARMSGGPGNIEVEYLNWRGSGDLVCASHANCYLVVPDDRERLNTGEEVSVLIFGTELR
jgi:molybdopterin molybdotransferase